MFQTGLRREFFRFYTNKKVSRSDSYRDQETLRGFDQIRTGVEGFADLCLATRPRNPLLRFAKL